MKSDLKTRHGGRILADALAAQGVRKAFGVPGESYLPVLDGLHDLREQIEFVICRQEGGASYMAEAYGKLTGEPGVLFVTRGPGATNGSIGLHTGFQDSTPMVAFIGQVGNEFAEREAFQEIDYRRMYGQLTKWVAQIDRVERIPEYVSHAFHTATAGRPGPVALALPEDVLFADAAIADVPRHHVVRPAPPPKAMQELETLLEKAQRPFILVGGGGWDAATCKRLQKWIEAAGLPVGSSFRCQDLIDNRSPSYVGDVGIGINPDLAARVRDADVLLVIGARLGEMTTSAYTLVEAPVPRQTLIHVHGGTEELGRVYRPALPINSGMAEFVDALEKIEVKSKEWNKDTEGLRKNFIAWTEPRPMPGAVQYGHVIRWLSDHLPEDTIVTGGAGNFASWLHRHYRYKGFRTQLGSTAGSMGYGLPAAVAAKIAQPKRTVLALCGDGDFLMNGQEIATAAQYGAGFVALVVNNGKYGTIRMHQEREYPGRVYGTELKNPDFAAYARAFGGHGETVERTEDFAAAYARAAKAAEEKKAVSLIELKIDPDAITPATTLSAIREKALTSKR